jgi:hypothetical protein
MRIWDAVVEEESFWATSVVKKQQMVAWRGVAAPGGNGDGWTNRETPAQLQRRRCMRKAANEERDRE